MSWGYAVFTFLLCGFGIVYLFWPTNDATGNYGIFALITALVLCSLSLTRAVRAWKAGEWQRHAMLGLASGMWLWVIGGMLEAVNLIRSQVAYVSISDFLWVGGYLPMFAGLTSGFQGSASPGKHGARLVLLILGSCYIGVFHFYLMPQLSDPARSLPSKALDVIYVSSNFVLLAMLLTISRELQQQKSLLNTPVRLLSIATMIMIGTDTMLSYYTDPDSFVYHLLDVPYFLIYFLFFHAGQEFARLGKRKAQNNSLSTR